MAQGLNMYYEDISDFVEEESKINPDIGTITRMLEDLGNPERSFKCIHISGTNGKGQYC